MGKHFVKAYETKKGWKVKVYDKGLVTMCKFDNDKDDFVDCVFSTREEAEQAGKDYNDLWKD